MTHYETLGISAAASSDDVKRAFRRIAMRDHPDRNPGDSAAEERFKQAAAAFAVVGDPEKRHAYDRGEDDEDPWVRGPPDTLEYALDLFRSAMQGASLGWNLGQQINNAHRRTLKRACPSCGGRGQLDHQQGLFRLTRECTACEGSGEA